MAMSLNNLSMGDFANMVLPSAWAAAHRAQQEGIPINDVKVYADNLHDDIRMTVSHTLVKRSDIYLGKEHYAGAIGQRLNAAMRLFHRMPAAKALCVDRRRLIARGEKAIKCKAKRR